MKMLIRPVALVTILSVLGQALVSADTFTNVKLMVNTGEKA